MAAHTNHHVDEKTVPLTSNDHHHHHLHRKHSAGRMLLKGIRRIGEGPKLLRTLCFIGGAGMVTASCFNVASVLKAIADPAAYVLNFVLIFFGILVMAIETKDAFAACRPAEEFFEDWCRFLTVPFGKGLFYIFLGLLMAAQSWICISPSALVGESNYEKETWTALHVGLKLVGYFMAFMGVICCIWHKHAERAVAAESNNNNEYHANV